MKRFMLEKSSCGHFSGLFDEIETRKNKQKRKYYKFSDITTAMLLTIIIITVI